MNQLVLDFIKIVLAVVLPIMIYLIVMEFIRDARIKKQKKAQKEMFRRLVKEVMNSSYGLDTDGDTIMIIGDEEVKPNE